MGQCGDGGIHRVFLGLFWGAGHPWDHIGVPGGCMGVQRMPGICRVSMGMYWDLWDLTGVHRAVLGGRAPVGVPGRCAGDLGAILGCRGL